MNPQREHVVRLFPEINEIKEIGLRERVIDAWLLALEASDWERIEDLPWVPGRAEFITNVQHCRGVTHIALAIANTLLSDTDVAPDVIFDKDVVIAGCLLHDVGKLLEYSYLSDPPGAKTVLAKYMKHHLLGTYVAVKAGLPPEVVHCIESHLEPESFERSYEAKIVHYSDVLHARGVLTTHPGVSIT
jgi:putative nucleotidyltransferase with HDIG domain